VLIKLQEFYPNVDVPAKALAWFNLIGVCGTVYGPRITAVFIRLRRVRLNKVQAIN
jgi:hypothetical protein